MFTKYRVVVVEDEPRILNYIVHKIQNLDPRFEVVATSRNGKAALSVIDEYKPHIVFSDVKMPVMDGLELSKHIDSHDANIKIVIISGYRDFGYVQEAIRNSVTDYLLKPILDKELSRVLHDLADTLDKDYNHCELNAIRNAVNNKISHNKLNIIPDNREYSVILVCIGNLINDMLNNFYMNIYQAIYEQIDWPKILKKCGLHGDRWWICDSGLVNQKFIVIDSHSGILSKGDQICLIKMLKLEIGNYEVNISASDQTVSYSSISQIANSHKLRLGRMLSPGHSRLLSATEDISADCLSYILLSKEQIGLFKGHIINNNYDLAYKQLDILIKVWDKYLCPQRIIENNIRHLISIIGNLRTDIDDFDLFMIEYESLLCVSKCKSLLNALPEIWGIFLNILESTNDKSDFTSKTADDVEIFLREHYNEDISIDQLAKRMGFNSVYLSRLFKKRKKTTPMQVLIEARIDKAKQLLHDHPDWNLSLICESIGYNDSHYFSRAFKKRTGQSPSEYRKLCSDE